MAEAHVHGSGCQHHSAAGMSEGKVRLAMLLTFGFVVVEAFFGYRSHSLALLSDAGHNFTDAMALALSWYALRVARKPADSTRTYGYHRVGILTALFNALTLLFIAGFIFVEAYRLLLHPAMVSSIPMMGVAAIAVLLNTGIAVGLRGEAKHNVNMRSAYIHMAGDALSALGVILAGAVIHYTGWQYADPLVSVLIGLFIIYSSWGIVVETVNVLLEGAPRGLDMNGLVQAVQAVPGVVGVHDLHVWTIADNMNALSCHLRIAEASQSESGQIVRQVKTLLADRYAVHHSTLETECGGCDSNALYCSLNPSHEDAHHHHAPPQNGPTSSPRFEA